VRYVTNSVEEIADATVVLGALFPGV
jgi:hypothetical protein